MLPLLRDNSFLILFETFISLSYIIRQTFEHSFCSGEFTARAEDIAKWLEPLPNMS